MNELFYCAASVPLIWSAVTDLKKRAIPPAPLILLAALGIAKVIVLWPDGFVRAGTGLLCIGLPMLILSCKIDDGNGIGGGDVKICALLGFLLGLMNTLLVIAAALMWLLIYALIRRKKKLPFAPFLMTGYMSVLLLMYFAGGTNV